jgi:hypothetical protein
MGVFYALDNGFYYIVFRDVRGLPPDLNLGVSEGNRLSRQLDTVSIGV